MGERFGDDVGDAVAVALGIDHAGVPEDVGPPVLFVDLLGRERADQGNEFRKAIVVDAALEVVVKRAFAGNSCRERYTP